MTNESALAKLEYKKILDLISGFLTSNDSRGKLFESLPTSDFATVNNLLDATQEMYLVCNKYNASLFLQYECVFEILKKSAAGAVLFMSDLLRIANVLKSVRISKKAISATGEDVKILKQKVEKLIVNAGLEIDIHDSIASDTQMKDSASLELASIRRKIVATDNKAKEKLTSYIKKTQYVRCLQDAIVTVRNGRFVLPVKLEYKNEIRGLVHDRSASGSTLFIEPIEVLELNNELKSLQLEEEKEVEKILKIFSTRVAKAAVDIEKCQKTLTMLDIISAKMLFGESIRATKPFVNDKGIVNLKKARHPLIDKNMVVPVDLSFGKDCKWLLITGSNTGGKTVCLKIAGLFSLLASSGIFLPCNEGSEISIFDAVYCDIGDSQSILNSLSTFSSHILNIVAITKKATQKSLVLLDELGSGTDPEEGAALALGVIEYLEKLQAVGIITTHYHELKRYALTSKNIQNASMRFDSDTLKPTYQLIKGVPGASHALSIAETLGLNPKIIANAKSYMSNDSVAIDEILQLAEKAGAEALLDRQDAAKVKLELEKELQELRMEKAKLQERSQKIKDGAKVELRQIISNKVLEAEELVEKITELSQSVQQEGAILKAKQLKKKLENLQYSDEEPQSDINLFRVQLTEKDCVVGKEVYSNNLSTIVIISSLPNKRGEVTISANGMQIKTNCSNLSLLHKSEVKNTSSKCNHVTHNRRKNTSSAQNVTNVEILTQEIKILGLTVLEAIETIEPLIMSGVNSGMRLKIVHGKGTGALGKGIQKYLKSQKYIKSVRYGSYGEGETGVTIIEI